MRIRNVSPYGALDVPLLGRMGEPYDEPDEGCVSPGEDVEVTEDQARALLPQMTNWEPADAEAKAIADELAAAAEQLEAGTPPPAAALHAVWIAYAQGLGDPAAASKTKKQLVAEYGAQAEEGKS